MDSDGEEIMTPPFSLPQPLCRVWPGEVSPGLGVGAAWVGAQQSLRLVVCDLGVNWLRGGRPPPFWPRPSSPGPQPMEDIFSLLLNSPDSGNV